jgi:deoxyribose-phosphate aldolase
MIAKGALISYIDHSILKPNYTKKEVIKLCEAIRKSRIQIEAFKFSKENCIKTARKYGKQI